MKLTHSIALLMFLSFPLHTAFGWGLLNDLSESEPRSARLFAKVLRDHTIHYCIRIDRAAKNFHKEVLAPQIESALRLWLDASEVAETRSTAIKQISCAPNPLLDLEVEIGRSKPGDNSNGAFTEIVPRSRKKDISAHMLIKLDTDYVWKERRGLPNLAQGDYSWVDFASFVEKEKGETLQSLMTRISFGSPLTVDQFAEDRKLDYNRIFYSSYHVFIHELGHAFGLCDTFDPLYEVQCDPKFRSPKPQPASIMFNLNAFFLAEDDLKGIRALYARFSL